MTQELPRFFDDFIRNVRLQDEHKKSAKEAHTELREKIAKDEALRPIVESTFLQGSYRRGTGVKPYNDARADVDLVVVTNLARGDYPNPSDVFSEYFIPFVERHYESFDPDRGHSIAIHLPGIDLDLVPTSAPSLEQEKSIFSESVTGDEPLDDLVPGEWRLTESYRARTNRTPYDTVERFMERVARDPEWKTEPLWIPNRDRNEWEETDPLAQIRFTSEKNRVCNGYYLSVVRAIRWWRRLNATPKYPKGYPVEHLVGYVLEDGMDSIAEGVVSALQGIRERFAVEAALLEVPHVPDHGVPAHNVLGRLTGTDFAEFHALVEKGAEMARAAYERDDRRTAVRGWRDLFGEEFPDDPDKGDGGYPEPSGPANPKPARFG